MTDSAAMFSWRRSASKGRNTHNVFTQTDTSSVRAHGNPELSRHQKNGEDLAHSPETTRVNLTYVDRLGLQELLERHPVVGVLSGSNTNPVRLQLFPNRSVTESIIRGSRLLNEPAERVKMLSAGARNEPTAER